MSDSVPLVRLWLERLRNGHPDARNELMRHSRERLRMLTHQMLRGFPRLHNWEETSDVLQNVMIRLNNALETVSLREPRDFLRLATVQIRRELLDMTDRYLGPLGLGRNQVPLVDGSTADTVPEPVDECADPERLAKWHELHTYIANRDPEERELFELLYYQGLTQLEAAALLCVSLRTVKGRWQQARLRLMDRLGDDFLS